MKKPKLTPWFPADVKPVHVGVYEIYKRFPEDGPTFKHWDGGKWGYASVNPMIAKPASILGESVIQRNRWRGLANPPKETKQKGEK